MGGTPDLLIVGASGRAAAMSAVRAGFRPWVVDLFGDEDLRELAHEHRLIRDYGKVFAAIADWPWMPWLGTGAIENHPGLIRRISKDRPFWGNSAGVMELVRNPSVLATTLTKAGCPSLAIWQDDTPPPPDGEWMLKPLHSAGGQGVFIWNQETAGSQAAELTLNRPHYFQERAVGEGVSAVFLSDKRETSLIGISRLLLANDPTSQFGYGGMIGPVKLPGSAEGQITRQGEVVGKSFGLRGLWGMDFIEDGSTAWATEVNPRYTASVEIYEYATGVPLLSEHRRAFETPQKDFRNELQPNADSLKPTLVGKVVVYAERDLIIPPWGDWPTKRDAFLPELPTLADRPSEGSRVPRGFPICSLLAAAESENSCRRELNTILADFAAHFRQAGWEISLPSLQ